MSEPAPIPSSTLVLLRDGPREPQVLLLERAPGRDGGAGPWVFPGGKIEPGDRVHAQGETPGARDAAVRETREECGLVVDTEALVPVSRWVTPRISPRRFDTWFFAAHIDRERGEAVQVDGAEIVGHRWQGAEDALAAARAGEIALAPPTFVTLHWILGHRHSGAALEALGRPPFLVFHPRICPREGGACILYPGDAGYEHGDPERPGARHRLWRDAAGSRYELRLG